MKIRPLIGQVLVEMLPADSEERGLVLPECAQGKPYKAIVRELGPWPLNRKGYMIPYDFRKGNTVVVNPYAGVQLTRDVGERFKLVPWNKIIAVLETEIPSYAPGQRVKSGTHYGTITGKTAGWYHIDWDDGWKPYCCNHYGPHEFDAVEK